MTHDIPRFGTPDSGLTWASTGTHHGGPALMALAMAGQFPPAPEAPVDELVTRTADANFEGHQPRECGEHRTVGLHRAWCYDCREWCYPEQPCVRCERALLEGGLQDAIGKLTAERDTARAEAADLHAVAADAIAERDTLRAELRRWTSGQRRKGMPVVEAVPDGLHYAAALVRAQGTEGGEEHDHLLTEAGQRMKALWDAASALIAERDQLRAQVAELHARVAGAIRLADLSPLYGLDETWRRDNEAFNASLPALDDGETS